MAVLNRANKKIGCFVISGLSEDAFDVKPLVGYLKNQGYYTYCTGLTGFCDSSGSFNINTYRDCIIASEKVFKKFVHSCDLVVVIGFSLGSLAGIHLAERYHVDALITINAPVYYGDFVRFFKRRLINLYYTCVLRRIISSIKKQVKRLKCPLLVIQGKRDEMVRWMGAYYVYEKAISKEKEIQFFPKSGHFICQDCENKLVFIRIHQFIEKIMENKLLMEGYI